MRRVAPILFFILSLAVLPAHSQTLVQSVANACFGCGGPITLPFPSNVGANRTIIISTTFFYATCSNPAAGPPGVSDNIIFPGGWAGTPGTGPVMQNVCLTFGSGFLINTLWCAQTGSSSGPMTVSLSIIGSPLTSGIGGIATEWSGLDLTQLGPGNPGCVSDPSATGSNNSGTGGTSFTTNNITTTNANDLIVASAWFYSSGNNTTLTVGAPYTNRASYICGSGVGDCANQVSHMIAAQAVSSTGTYGATFTGNHLATDWMTTQFAIKLANTNTPKHAYIVKVSPGKFYQIPWDRPRRQILLEQT